MIRLDQVGNQVALHSEGPVCTAPRQVIESDLFRTVVVSFVDSLRKEGSPLLEAFPPAWVEDPQAGRVVHLLRALAGDPLPKVAELVPQGSQFLDPDTRGRLHEFVESLYDFWRARERVMVLHVPIADEGLASRPHDTFDATVEVFNRAVRSTYRDIRGNIVGAHPHVYRQLPAGCNMGLQVSPSVCPLPPPYAEVLDGIPFIRHVWLVPPLLLDPPANKRGGRFLKVDDSPLRGLVLSKDQWLCYPAQVGELTVLAYFNLPFLSLGCALANLFDLASDERLAKGADAVCLFGAPPAALERFGEPVVFHDDEEHGVLVGAVPAEPRFAYFGYLKKTMLVLHNAAMMKRGRMPFHGAMVNVRLGKGAANVMMIGDTGTGKSETLEAMRLVALSAEGERREFQELRIIADDMGSLALADDGRILGYGTETGAFVRLDDLEKGYAFRQVDRAIFMSAQKINARVVLPVTTLRDVTRGYPLTHLLYANNYEAVDAEHPVLERYATADAALRVFREGAAMSKGTTTSTGLVHNYFANIFGPPAYKDLHERLAVKTFEAAFAAGVYVGQLRTRLALPGFETEGPKQAAIALFNALAK
jgi:hypothetical protein